MKIVLGTMNFGPQLDLEASRTMVNAYLATGGRELDTAYVYNGGTTEEYLGEILPELNPQSYEIATKVHPAKSSCSIVPSSFLRVASRRISSNS